MKNYYKLFLLIYYNRLWLFGSLFLLGNFLGENLVAVLMESFWEDFENVGKSIDISKKKVQVQKFVGFRNLTPNPVFSKQYRIKTVQIPQFLKLNVTSQGFVEFYKFCWKFRKIVLHLTWTIPSENFWIMIIICWNTICKLRKN
jgi:hypothetical protein